MKGAPQDAGQQSTVEEEELHNEDSTDNAPDSFPSSQPWANIYDTFMPLLLSMTFNSPLKFWELTYMQQQQQFNSTEDDQEKLVSKRERERERERDLGAVILCSFFFLMECNLAEEFDCVVWL